MTKAIVIFAIAVFGPMAFYGIQMINELGKFAH